MFPWGRCLSSFVPTLCQANRKNIGYVTTGIYEPGSLPAIKVCTPYQEAILKADM